MALIGLLGSIILTLLMVLGTMYLILYVVHQLKKDNTKPDSIESENKQE